MRIKAFSLITGMAFFLLLLAGCSSPLYSSLPATSKEPTASSPTAASEAAVTISGFAFSPPTLTVAKGTTIKWTNSDPTSHTVHTVTSDTGIWDSGELAPGGTFSHTFSQTGTFPYHCKIHPSMTAKVVVQ